MGNGQRVPRAAERAGGPKNQNHTRPPWPAPLPGSPFCSRPNTDFALIAFSYKPRRTLTLNASCPKAYVPSSQVVSPRHIVRQPAKVLTSRKSTEYTLIILVLCNRRFFTIAAASSQGTSIVMLRLLQHRRCTLTTPASPNSTTPQTASLYMFGTMAITFGTR